MTERYQTFWQRFWAGMVDGLVFLPLSFVDDYLSSPERGMVVVILWVALTNSAGWIYSVLFHWRRGQTLGKMATRVKVLDLSEDRLPSLKQALLRDVVYIIPNVLLVSLAIVQIVRGEYSPLALFATLSGKILIFASSGWFIIELITMLTNKKRRALHDFIAGTVVVRSA